MRFLTALLIAVFAHAAHAGPIPGVGSNAGADRNRDPAPGGSAFDLSYVTSVGDGTTQTTYTFTSQSFGATTGGTRYILVVNAWSSSTGHAAPTTITIGDDAAAARLATSGSSTAGCAIFRGAPTGTSGDVIITYPGSNAGATNIGIYRLMNPSSSTPSATVNATHVSGVVTLATNIAAGGKAVAVAGSRSGSTWTPTNAIEDFDIVTGSSNVSGNTSTTVGTPTNIVLTNANSSPANATGCSNAWIP